MIHRPVWIERINNAWRAASIVWLAGPRRTGKTVLAQAIHNSMFLNCDLPSVAERMQEPETFFRSVEKQIIIFDEVHQLVDPSRVLKIAADSFPHLKVLATGSSTLAATRKFRDSLTGRKRVISFVPVLYEELEAFGINDLTHRLLRGGLPPALLSREYDPEFYSEWLDSYFARDVQELFRVHRRAGFLAVFELLLRQSGGMLDISKISRESQVTRPTIMSWLDMFQTTQVARLVRPFSGGGRREIVARPKVYCFDTGLICFARSWDVLRPEDTGLLWEHLVLDEIIATGTPKVFFWRDKQQREVDFVLPSGREKVIAIECKWNTTFTDIRGISAFRQNYSKGSNYVVCPLQGPPYEKSIDGVNFTVINPGDLRLVLKSQLML